MHFILDIDLLLMSSLGISTGEGHGKGTGGLQEAGQLQKPPLIGLAQEETWASLKLTILFSSPGCPTTASPTSEQKPSCRPLQGMTPSWKSGKALGQVSLPL